MSGFFNFLRSKASLPAAFTGPQEFESTSFKGKTVLITGSNTGLGLHAAQRFLKLNVSHVILAVRNVTKGEDARGWLEASPGKYEAVSVLPLDMNSFASINDFVDHHLKAFEHIDIAVLNAGLLNRQYTSSPEGWEETLQVNTLSTTLLALLLLPKLRAAKTAKRDSMPHLVLVSSGKHNSITRDALPSPLESVLHFVNASIEPASAFDGQRQYGISKLLLMYTLEPLAKLATLPNGEPQVIVTSCNPGFCASDLGRQYDAWYMKVLISVIHRTIAKSTEEGSRTLVNACTLGVEAQAGYYNRDQLMRPSELVVGPEGPIIQKQVWKEIVDVLKIKVPEVESLAMKQTLNANLE